MHIAKLNNQRAFRDANARKGAPIRVTFLCKLNQLDSTDGRCRSKSMLS